jgi:hypothetical protein
MVQTQVSFAVTLHRRTAQQIAVKQRAPRQTAVRKRMMKTMKMLMAKMRTMKGNMMRMMKRMSLTKLTLVMRKEKRRMWLLLKRL